MVGEKGVRKEKGREEGGEAIDLPAGCPVQMRIEAIVGFGGEPSLAGWGRQAPGKLAGMRQSNCFSAIAL